jgi:serine/threonine protein kinase
MKHPRVVQLFDVFEIDMNSFATVLEYCRGIDLDEKLKRHKSVPEKDAKAIFMQILSGLRYLHHPYSYNAGGLYLGEDNSDNSANATNPTTNGSPASLPSSNSNNNNSTVLNTTNTTMISTDGSSAQNKNNNAVVTNHTKKISIIHFDLKPANILFDEFGDVKITDFGLSKVIDESHEGTSMELTSQGAGTYWYLSPECFEKGPNPPRISSKVDVWSAGIIFYQMLYGSRPFGEGKTQENVWNENLIYNASSVEFPSDPKHSKISDEAKDLIRACLTRDQRLRPDVIGVCQHPYFKAK